MIFDDTSNANLRNFQSLSDSGQCYAIAAYFNIDSIHSKTIKILFYLWIENAKFATAFSWGNIQSVSSVIFCVMFEHVSKQHSMNDTKPNWDKWIHQQRKNICRFGALNAKRTVQLPLDPKLLHPVIIENGR